jgi:hypothetical protein
MADGAASAVPRRYLTTTDAALYLGVCRPTFRKMIAALPASRRPKPVQFPGVTVKRWIVDDLDRAFSAASASSGWDRLVEDGAHVEGRERMGRGRARAEA